MKELLGNSLKHLGAIILFIGLTVTYFSPTFQGEQLVQGDIQKYRGMVQELEEYSEKEDGSSAWLGSMFSGMPSYQVKVYGTPYNFLKVFDVILKPFDYQSARVVLMSLISFYLLMCVMAINPWLSIAGAIGYTFASYNFIILAAGHVTKAYVIALMPLTIAGMFLLFKRKWLWGFLLFSLGVALSVYKNHLQITYYLAIACAILYVGYSVIILKRKEVKQLGVVTLLLALGAFFAVFPNIDSLYTSQELAKESTRGASELTQEHAERPSGGLAKDYAFAWSYGKMETLTLLIPNAFGGETGGELGGDSHLAKALRQHGMEAGQKVQTYTYWGDQPFTSGPVYFGAIICFLFMLGMFLIDHPIKWWALGISVFFIFLSWGKNFDGFNTVMFHYFPYYNKFRTVSMALVIPGLIFPVIGLWGLSRIWKGEVEAQHLRKSLTWSLAILGGLSLIIAVIPGLFLNFTSVNDSLANLPDWYMAALHLDRADLAQSDAWRSLIFISISAGMLYFLGKTDRQNLRNMIAIAFVVLMLADLWSVDKRYLDNDNFSTKKILAEFTPSVADKAILEDKHPSYRVFNLNNPFQETNTSYFHKSIGGYHAAKLRRYQELIDHQLMGEHRAIVEGLKSATTVESLYKPLSTCNTLNMLNARYIIYSPNQLPIQNPYAYGNAWFVDAVNFVDNADQEMAALNSLDPLREAVADKKFESLLQPFEALQQDSLSTIIMTSYKPDRIVYNSKTEKPRLAVFSEIYYPHGWSAFIDGKPVNHFRVDWILRAMNIPAGEHEIEFVFEPKTFNTLSRVASVSSLLLLLSLLGMIVYSSVKREKDPKNE